MEIIKIPIVGWCKGVKNIFKKIDIISKTNKSKNLYCLGQLVHSVESNNLLKKYKIKTIKKIADFPIRESNILLLPAHGTPKNILDVLIQKKAHFYELKCPFVHSHEIRIKNKLANGYGCYFIGHKDHLETQSILSLDHKIKFIDINNFFAPSSKNKKIYITNQTTLNSLKIDSLKSKLKKYEFENGCCPEILKRQSTLNSYLKKIDFLIVVGDKNSNNANELINIAKQGKIKCLLINSPSQINKSYLRYKKVGITTSASTPITLFNKIYKKLVSIAN